MCINSNIARTHTSNHIQCMPTQSQYKVPVAWHARKWQPFHITSWGTSKYSWPIPPFLTMALWAWTLNGKGNTTCLSCYRRDILYSHTRFWKHTHCLSTTWSLSLATNYAFNPSWPDLNFHAPINTKRTIKPSVRCSEKIFEMEKSG